jgi:sec-independent protein translocase protein TatA
MLEYSLNVIGSEWMIIIFVALILLLGTNRFPEAAKKIGKMVGEFNKAKNEIQNEMKDVASENIEISGPVKNEREKLEIMAKTIGIDSEKKTDGELRTEIASKIGQRETDEQSR